MKNKFESIKDISSTYYSTMNRLKNTLQEESCDLTSHTTIHKIQYLLNEMDNHKGFELKHVAVLITFEKMCEDILLQTNKQDSSSYEFSDSQKGFLESLSFKNIVSNLPNFNHSV